MEGGHPSAAASVSIVLPLRETPMSLSPPATQYHHYIPRFILRRFQPNYDERKAKSKKQRQKESKNAKKRGRPDPESIFVFELETGLLELRPIARVYGEFNLYQDGQERANMNHLEEKLAVLEQDAAKIITLLHDSSHTGEFKIRRRELETLRKFLFLMHYRSNAVNMTYFQEDHPRNAPVRQWIRRFKEKRGLRSDLDIWLDGLRYYLETPHLTIIDHAKSYQERVGPDQLLREALGAEIDPEMDQWHALAYEGFANDYFMGIWKAADSSEFVLGHNAFGLWEGSMAGAPGLYRLKTVSPKIVLMLKLNMSKNPMFSMMEMSTLTGIPLVPPEARYAALKLKKIPTEQGQYNALQQYIRTEAAAKDEFTFKITSLSEDQTYLVNQIFLQNLQNGGSLAFVSRNAMAETVRRYDTDEGPFEKENRSKIRVLGKLLDPSITTHADAGSVLDPDPHVRSESPTDEGDLPGLSVDGRGQWLDADLGFHDMLRDVVNNSLEFASDYDRALYILRLMHTAPQLSHPLAKLALPAIMRCVKISSTLMSDGGREREAASKSRLIESLNPEQASRLFSLGILQLERLGVEMVLDAVPFPLLRDIIAQVTIIGYLEQMIAIKKDFASIMFPSIPLIQPTHREEGEVRAFPKVPTVSRMPTSTPTQESLAEVLGNMDAMDSVASFVAVTSIAEHEPPLENSKTIMEPTSSPLSVDLIKPGLNPFTEEVESEWEILGATDLEREVNANLQEYWRRRILEFRHQRVAAFYHRENEALKKMLTVIAFYYFFSPSKVFLALFCVATVFT